jgi:hypothetical protein
MAAEFGHGMEWQNEQVASFTKLAGNYMLNGN